MNSFGAFLAEWYYITSGSSDRPYAITAQQFSTLSVCPVLAAKVHYFAVFTCLSFACHCYSVLMKTVNHELSYY